MSLVRGSLRCWHTTIVYIPLTWLFSFLLFIVLIKKGNEPPFMMPTMRYRLRTVSFAEPWQAATQGNASRSKPFWHIFLYHKMKAKEGDIYWNSHYAVLSTFGEKHFNYNNCHSEGTRAFNNLKCISAYRVSDGCRGGGLFLLFIRKCMYPSPVRLQTWLQRWQVLSNKRKSMSFWYGICTEESLVKARPTVDHHLTFRAL